jgi:hypothetical protein
MDDCIREKFPMTCRLLLEFSRTAFASVETERLNPFSNVKVAPHPDQAQPTLLILRTLMRR